MFNQCAFPRCPELIRDGKYCPRHQPKEIDRSLLTSQGREQHKHYLSSDHKRWREVILNRDPLCIRCLKKNILTPSTVAHHVDGDWRNIALSNGEGLCAACHVPTFHKEILDGKQRESTNER